MKPSGRIRYRCEKDWRGKQKLVLQIEIVGRDVRYIGGFVESYDRAVWRDATIQDVTTKTSVVVSR